MGTPTILYVLYTTKLKHLQTLQACAQQLLVDDIRDVIPHCVAPPFLASAQETTSPADGCKRVVFHYKRKSKHQTFQN